MSGALDKTARRVADSLTRKFGTNGRIRVKTNTIDPATGKVTATADSDTPVPITPPSASPPRELVRRRGDIDDTIKVGQLWTSIPALGLVVVPEVGYKFLFQAETAEYEIIAVYPLSSGNLIANYTIQCKQ